jgi:predicted secreted protein
MANTYTPKLNLAKPAHGDVDWHIPVNENWDKLDSKLGPLYENITNDTTKLTVKKDIDMSGKNITNIASIQTGILQSPNIRPYICVASDEIRYESLTTASSKIYSDIDPRTATLKTYRIPTGAPYYGAGYYQMSVRVTAKCTLSYVYSEYSATVGFWIKVDGETKKTIQLTNNATQNVTWDVNVNPSSVISLGASVVSIKEYYYATASISDFRIRASDTFAEPQGW